MVSSLLVVSVADLAGVLPCFLLENQMKPPTIAKTATAMRRPVGFMSYLLFHQVAIPIATTPNGKLTTLSQKTGFRPLALMLIGRSSGILGRMEIRSSSEASQFTMLASRS